MKKNIIFMAINMNVGGTERALLNMIAEMPRAEYDITLLMLEKYGGFLESIPSNVHVKYLDGYQDIKDVLNKPPKVVIWESVKKGRFIKGLNLFLVLSICKLMRRKDVFFKYILKHIPVIQTEYDIAVAYAGPMDVISYFVVNKIKAEKKIQWIHFDVTKIGFDKSFASRVYMEFDKVFVVSKEAKRKFVDIFPTLTSATEVFSNVISPDLIYSHSINGRGFDDDFDGIRILTVGRLAFEKGQDIAIKVLDKLIHDGFNVRWYCLGEGISRNTYEQLIRNNNLQGKCMLLGSDSNPYPYIAHCDIYVQPSRYEGYCITLAEAKLLNKPIVTTDFTGAREQIINNEEGLIVDIDENDIYGAIKKLINNPTLRQKFSHNLANQTRDNTTNVEKLQNLV